MFDSIWFKKLKKNWSAVVNYGLSEIEQKSENRFLLFLSFLVGTLLVSLTLTHRALFSDGTYAFYHTIYDERFQFYETGRMFIHALDLFPLTFWVQVGLPLANFSMASYFFSFGFYWVFVVSLAVCYVVLPKDKKYLFFFPLAQWLFGILVGIGQPTTCMLDFVSYFWAVLFVLLYAPLSSWWSRTVFLIFSIPLMLSHEFIGVLGLVLAGFAYLRWLKEEKGLRAILTVFIIWCLLCSILGVYFFVFPTNVGHRDYFMWSMLVMKFLFLGYSLEFSYFALISISVVTTILSWSLLARHRFFKFTLALSSIIAFLTSLVFVSKLFDYEKILYRELPYDGRVWVSLSVPILLAGFWFSRHRHPPRIIWYLSSLTAFVLVVGHSISNTYFSLYLDQVRQALSSCRGEIELHSQPPKLQNPELLTFWRNWTTIEASAIVAPGFKVRALFTNRDEFIQKGTIEDLEDTAYRKRSRYFDFSEYFAYVKNGKSGCN